MKSIFFSLVILSTVFVGCNSEKSANVEKDDNTKISSTVTTPQNQLITNNTSTTTPAQTGPQTTVELSDTKFDFGTIDAGEVVTTKFVIKNTGKEPMVINSAKSTCGCTIPKIQKDVPIAPGESTEVEVKFDSKSKSGKINRAVTITGNFPTTRFNVTGNVTGAAKPNVQVNPVQ